MDLTLESVALAVVFLLPGYAAQSLARAFTTRTHDEPSTLESLLTSLGVTTAILVVEAMVVLILAGFVATWEDELLDGLDLQVLVKSGARDYLLLHPWDFSIAALTVAAVTAAVAFLVGYHDPVGRMIRRKQLRNRLVPEDVWTTAMAQDLLTGPYRTVHASMKLKGTGDVLRGQMRAISVPNKTTGIRDIVLNHVTVIPTDGPPRRYWEDKNRLSAALIRSDEIESIVLLYESSGAQGGQKPA